MLNVDLTAAAKFYGCEHIPPIVQCDDDGLENAAYDVSNDKIDLGSRFTHIDLTSSYSEGRFTRAGAPRLNQEDGERFVLAHELWHARQSELDPIGQILHGGTATESDHDADPIEVDADRHAALAYKLVRISGKEG